jgi:hypothetical protein
MARFNLPLKPAATIITGNLGWESGTYRVTLKGAVGETGKFLSVNVKKHHAWSCLRDTWNADTAPAATAK